MTTGRWDFGLSKKIITVIALMAIVGTAYMLGKQYVLEMTARINDNPSLQVSSDSAKYRQQRNDLSRQLNSMKQANGQQSCEKLKILRSSGKSVELRVSENGGWCEAASAANSSSHAWDKGFSTALSRFLKGKAVASFGDGPGMYKKHIDSLGEVASYTAYDGAPYCEQVTNGQVKFLDLSAPQYGLPGYDWVVSVEVGEHIPAKYEDIFLDNLARHAKEGIVLSWAVPGQGGLSHVNNKALVDVVAQMNKRGFDINKEASKPLQGASKFRWLKSNVFVYYRINPQTFIPEDA